MSPASCEALPSQPQAWRIANAAAELVCRAGPRGLEPVSMADLRSQNEWPFARNAAWPWLKLACQGEAPAPQALTFTFQSSRSQAQEGGLTFQAVFGVEGFNGLRLVESVWLSDGLPVFRRWSELENAGGSPVLVESLLLLDLALGEDLVSGPLELFYVDAFAGHRRDNWEPGDLNFGVHTHALGPGGSLRLEMGAYRPQCSWLALRRPAGAGLVLGLEYAAGAELRAYDIQRVAVGDSWAAAQPLGPGLRLAAQPAGKINALVQPGESWKSPAAFWGLFEGGWDDAAHLTHAFVESHLAPPWPDEHFPYAELNTWGYAFDLTPADAWRLLETAAEIGAEVFDADYGWMERVGDWQAVERNFPPLRSLSDRAHQLGLKFGLWMSFANAHPDSRVAREHPGWLAWPDAWGSFGTRALCLANRETFDWAYEQVRSVIAGYGVDHFKFDFEVITPCADPTHSHPPDPAGYHSSRAFGEILRRLRQEFPNLVIESCAGGGRLMTYEMVGLADTSITSDGGVLRDPLARRSALFGASYPFPLRYCDNYMEEAPTDLACHASMIGGPWMIMDRAVDWTAEQKACARRNIELYKRIRRLFRRGRVYHLLPPDGSRADALQVQVPAGSGVAYLFNPPLARDSRARLALKGLEAARLYRLVSSRLPGEAETLYGEQLMAEGVERFLQPGESEIIEIEPV